jgi:hypothetical protein
MTTQGVTKPENYRRITLTVDQFYAQAAERIYGRLACKQHASMQAVWDAAPSRYLRALAVEDDVVALPTLWRFALWCIRRHWILLRTEERRNFVDLVELYVDGKIDVLDVCDAWRDLNEPPVPDQTSAQLRADKAVEQLAGAAACINNGVDYARNRLCNVAKETEEAVEGQCETVF